MNRVMQTRLLALANVPLLRAKAPFQGHGRSDCWIVKLQPGHVNVSSNRRFTFGFCSCSLPQAVDLAGKKCFPCNSKNIRVMSEQSAKELLVQVPGWGLISEGGILKLHRSWKVKSFTKGLEFFQLVANIAEAEGHHPDLHLVGWNNVKIDLWTHSAGGLTENDFILAAKINTLSFDHLLRKKASA